MQFDLRSMLKLILATLSHLPWAAASDNFPAPSVLNTKQGVVACFWETYLYPNFTLEDIEANLCNHIVYGTAKLDNTTWELTHDNVTIDIDLGGFKNVSEMKMQDPNLKVEIGAWSQQNQAWQTPKEYFEMIMDSTRRETFVKSVSAFVTKNKFDGFHLHWGNPKCSEVDLGHARPNLTLLLRELKTALHMANKTLSVTLWAPLSSSIDKNFEIANIYNEADLVFVNAFHYFGNWFQKTGGFAPLYPGKGNKRPDDQYLNVDESWQHLMRRKAIPCKTVLVVSPKGSGFKLKNATENGMEALSVERAVNSSEHVPSIGAEPKFNEICTIIHREWARVWDKDRQVPYMYRGDEWASYEDEQSVEAKVGYANKEGLAGVAINNLAYDDFDGRCNLSRRFPLVSVVKENLRKGDDCKEAGSASSAPSSLPILLLLATLVTFKF